MARKQKIGRTIAAVKDQLKEAPWKEYALDYEWHGVHPKFNCREVHDLLLPLVRAPTKATPDNITNVATALNTRFTAAYQIKGRFK